MTCPKYPLFDLTNQDPYPNPDILHLYLFIFCYLGAFGLVGVVGFWKKLDLEKEKMNMMTMEGMMDKGVLEDIIRRLLEGKGGKQVQLSEGEIRQLCVNARQIFLSQPNLLQLHAPVRICGQFLSPLYRKLMYSLFCDMGFQNKRCDAELLTWVMCGVMYLCVCI